MEIGIWEIYTATTTSGPYEYTGGIASGHTSLVGTGVGT